MASLGSDFLGFNEAIEKKNMASKAPLFDPIYLFLKYLSDRTKKPSLLWKIKKKKDEEEGAREWKWQSQTVTGREWGKAMPNISAGLIPS